MIGDVVVAQALDAFLEAHEALPPKPDCVVGESRKRPASGRPLPFSADDAAYFAAAWRDFRSQQVSGLMSAFVVAFSRV